MARVPDLVRDSELKTRFRGGRTTIHYYRESDGRSRATGATQQEHWKRTRRLGQGSFATVWLEKCVKSERRAAEGEEPEVRAVKEISKAQHMPNAINFDRELEAVAKFSHQKYVDCFVRSFGWFQNESNLYIAMEYLPEGDLHEYLLKTLIVPEAEVQQVAFQMLEGLVFLHENGFTHRDLKPRNILIKQKPPESWWVKIGDFGISKRIEVATNASSVLQGTLGFMAPELHGFVDGPKSTGSEADLDASQSVDTWALGEIAFRMLTGSACFTSMGLLAQYASGAKAFPTDLLNKQAVGGAATDFLAVIMSPSPWKRPTAKQASMHSWFETPRAPSPASISASSTRTWSSGNRDSMRTENCALDDPSAVWTAVSGSMRASEASHSEEATIAPRGNNDAPASSNEREQAPPPVVSLVPSVPSSSARNEIPSLLARSISAASQFHTSTVEPVPTFTATPRGSIRLQFDAVPAHDTEVATHNAGDMMFCSSDTAFRVIKMILYHLHDPQDLFNASLVSRGFYQTFRRHDSELLENALWYSCRPAWEYVGMSILNMSDADRGLHMPNIYREHYVRSLKRMSSLKSALTLNYKHLPITLELQLRLFTTEGQVLVDISNAIWRLWSFCALFGHHNQIDNIGLQKHWLRGGSFSGALMLHDVGHRLRFKYGRVFAQGNFGGLTSAEIDLMGQLWQGLERCVSGYKSWNLAQFYGIFNLQRPRPFYHDQTMRLWRAHLLLRFPGTHPEIFACTDATGEKFRMATHLARESWEKCWKLDDGKYPGAMLDAFKHVRKVLGVAELREI